MAYNVVTHEQRSRHIEVKRENSNSEVPEHRSDDRALVMHILFRLDTGGLEQVLLQTVAGLSISYRHIVLSLTDASPSMKSMLPEGVEVIELNKRSGNDFGVWWAIHMHIRRVSPQVVHTYNIACLEYQIVAWLNGVPRRIHAEHGRSAKDPLGLNKKYRLLRQVMKYIVSKWIAVSQDLYLWLHQFIKIKAGDIVLIRNGIEVFDVPDSDSERSGRLDGFCSQADFIVGTVGRLDPVKNQIILVELWEQLKGKRPVGGGRLILAIIGDGQEKERLIQKVSQYELQEFVWMPGERKDVVRLLGELDLFVLPSIAEGIPISVLEAMAAKLPIIASKVGGLPEVVTPDAGTLVPPNDLQALSDAVLEYVENEDLRFHSGAAGRERVISEFSNNEMVRKYAAVYSKC